MYRLSTAILLLALTATLPQACGDLAPPGPEATGLLRLAVTSGTGVAAVRFTVVCEGADAEHLVVDVEEEGLPPDIDGDLAGRVFADLFVVTEEGTTCLVSAQALDANGAPLEYCPISSASVEIRAGETTEVLLVIVCRETPSGSGDVAVVVDTAPTINQVVVAPGLSIQVGDTVQITIDAVDRDGDELTYDFTVTPPQPDSVFELSSDGATATVRASTVGDYDVEATVSDGWATTSAAVTVTVTDRI